jgi:acetate kinase
MTAHPNGVTQAKAVETSRGTRSLLTINGGSSSIRFALYEEGEPLRLLLNGKVDRVGLSGTNLSFKDSTGLSQDSRIIDLAHHPSAVAFLLDWLETQQVFASVKVVGHRVVHGMTHSAPERVTQELLDELRRITPYDPEHLALEVELIEAFRQRHPRLPQVACFDTAFHHTMPRVASLLPIPRRYEAAGVRRYGFHGLSYEFLIDELARLGDPAAAKGRVILAHLGNGASLAARRQEHRHQHGLHTDGRSGDEQSLGRLGSRTGLLPGTHRANDRDAISGNGDPRIWAAWSFRDQLRPARFARKGVR